MYIRICLLCICKRFKDGKANANIKHYYLYSKYHIAGNFRIVLFLKILKMAKHFQKYFFELLGSYDTAQMQRRTRSTTRCSLHARTGSLRSRVCKLATQKSLYTWFTTKLLYSKVI